MWLVVLKKEIGILEGQRRRGWSGAGGRSRTNLEQGTEWSEGVAWPRRKGFTHRMGDRGRDRGHGRREGGCGRGCGCGFRAIPVRRSWIDLDRPRTRRKRGLQCIVSVLPRGCGLSLRHGLKNTREGGGDRMEVEWRGVENDCGGANDV